jgi:hypothetical protein
MSLCNLRQSWPGPHRCPPPSVPVPLIQGFCCLVLSHAPPEFDYCLIDGNSTVSQAPTFKQRLVSPLSSLTSSISTGTLYPRLHNPLSLICSSSLPHFLSASRLSSRLLCCFVANHHALILAAFTHGSLPLPLCISPSAPNPNLLPAFLSPRTVRSSSRPPCPAYCDRP